MERPRPLHPATDVPEHVRSRVRVHAPAQVQHAPGPRPLQGPRLQQAQEVPPNRDGGQLVPRAQERIASLLVVW